MGKLNTVSVSIPEYLLSIRPARKPIYQSKNIDMDPGTTVKEIYKCFDWIESNTKYIYQDIEIKWIKGKNNLFTLKAYAPKEEKIIGRKDI